MFEKMYAVIFKNDQDQEQIIAIDFNEDKAFEIMRNTLANNPNIKTEQIYINEYFLKKVNKILDLSI